MDKITQLLNESEKDLKEKFIKIDELELANSRKVLDSFHKYQVNEADFNSTTGYGYDDIGRDKIDKIFAEIFKAEDGLVRGQFISGSHALTVTLFALLRPGDVLLSICGKPYDTLDEVIGIVDNSSSLKSFGISYEQVELVDDDFDYDTIKKVLTSKKVKVVELQRSKGYSTRKSLTIDKVEKVASFIKTIDPEVIIMVDNCYCEFVNEREPIEVGCDICVGSLIKNLGGGIAPNGAYVVGRSDLISLVADRLTVPGEGREVGPTLGINKSFLQGVFMAPSVVASSLKTAVLTSYLFEKLGYEVEPSYQEERADIVQNVIFHDKDKLIEYCKGIQAYSPVNASFVPLASDMPGYQDQVIMAAGTFTQGSSIELSCDGPIREPYIAYQQGGLTYVYGKIAVTEALTMMLSK